MFVFSNRNVILPSPDGSRAFPLGPGFLGERPDWGADTEYFPALVKEGEIFLSASHKDRDVEAAQKKRRKGD